MANDWIRGLVTPVVVAVIVGLASAYMASANALAVHGERLKHIDERLTKVEAQTIEFAKYDARLARMEAQMIQVMDELRRINAKLDRQQILTASP